jgi:hypothetical protein
MDAELDLHTMPPRKDVTVIEVDLASCMDNINEVSPEAPVLLDNLLYNIGMDASLTELICISPGGLEFDREYIKRVANEMIKASKQLNNQPPALILPLYSPKSTLTDREKVEVEEHDIEQYGEEEAKLRVYDPVPYPPRGSFCGDQQSIHLVKPYRDAKIYESRSKNNYEKSNSNKSLHTLVRVDSHAHDLLKERSLLLPVIFNTSSSPHGKDFVRFPEEMSGIGCYGASIYRILTGSGYVSSIYIFILLYIIIIIIYLSYLIYYYYYYYYYLFYRYCYGHQLLYMKQNLIIQHQKHMLLNHLVDVPLEVMILIY